MDMIHRANDVSHDVGNTDMVCVHVCVSGVSWIRTSSDCIQSLAIL